MSGLPPCVHRPMIASALRASGSAELSSASRPRNAQRLGQHGDPQVGPKRLASDARDTRGPPLQ